MTGMIQEWSDSTGTMKDVTPGCPAGASLVLILDQLAQLVGDITDDQYRLKPPGFTGSIGGHVRHCLDHIDALLAAVSCGQLDYDARRRGTEVETCPRVARAALARQQRQLLDLPFGIAERPLRLTILLSSLPPAFEFATTVGRELAFVLSHTIHHNALIAVMAARLNLHVPDRFGYAPATIAHLENTRCVR